MLIHPTLNVAQGFWRSFGRRALLMRDTWENDDKATPGYIERPMSKVVPVYCYDGEDLFLCSVEEIAKVAVLAEQVSKRYGGVGVELHWARPGQPKGLLPSGRNLINIADFVDFFKNDFNQLPKGEQQNNSAVLVKLKRGSYLLIFLCCCC